MKVKELIEQLQECNEEADVMIDIKGYDWAAEHLKNVYKSMDNETVYLLDH